MPRPRVALGDAHHEPQVGLDQLALGPLAGVHRTHAASGARPHRVTVGAIELERRRDCPSSIALGETTLVVAAEQVDAADLLAGTSARDRSCCRRRHRPADGPCAGDVAVRADPRRPRWHRRRRQHLGVTGQRCIAGDAVVGRVVDEFVDGLVDRDAAERPARPGPSASTSPLSSTLRRTWVISSAWSTPRARPRSTRSFHSSESTPANGAAAARPVSHPSPSSVTHAPPCVARSHPSNTPAASWAVDRESSSDSS